MGQPTRQMGADAAKMLMDRIGHPNRKREVKTYTPQLIVRSSTAPLR